MSDRRPLKFETRFLWHPVPENEAMGDQYDYLPRDVFDRLDGFIPRENPKVNLVVKAYRSRGEAMDALRRATGETGVVLDGGVDRLYSASRTDHPRRPR